MTEERFNRLLDTTPGIGVECVTVEGHTPRYFYEDFPGDKGITRAMKQLYPLMEKGRIIKLTFIERAKKRAPSA